MTTADADDKPQSLSDAMRAAFSDAYAQKSDDSTPKGDADDTDADELDELADDTGDEDEEQDEFESDLDADLDALANGDDEQDDEQDDDDSDDDEDTDDDPFGGLDPEATVQATVNGEVVEVTLDEAVKGYQRQSDYTRAKQQLKQERDALEAERTELEQAGPQLTEDDESWLQQRETFAADPAGFMAEQVLNDPDPKSAFSELVVAISPELAENIGIDVATVQQQRQMNRRFAGLEQKLEGNQSQRQQAPAGKQASSGSDEERTKQQAAHAKLQSQYDRIIEREGGAPFSPAVTVDTVISFALENEMGSLEAAYERMAREHAAKQARKRPAKRKAKGKGKSLSPTSGSGSSQTQSAKPPKGDMKATFAHVADELGLFR